MPSFEKQKHFSEAKDIDIQYHLLYNSGNNIFDIREMIIIVILFLLYLVFKEMYLIFKR